MEHYIIAYTIASNDRSLYQVVEKVLASVGWAWKLDETLVRVDTECSIEQLDAVLKDSLDIDGGDTYYIAPVHVQKNLAGEYEDICETNMKYKQI